MLRPLIRFVVIAALAATRAPAEAKVTAASAVATESAGFGDAAGVVATENPHAAAVGASVLASGGSAVDAAIATALAVCVVHPTSCGIGGGGFMVGWDAATRRAWALDFRETAPAAIAPALFDKDGKYDPARSRTGGLAVGVPGDVAGLAEAQHRYGRLAWREVVAPAARLARTGFVVSPHLAQSIAKNRASLAADPPLASVFLTAAGEPLAAGSRLRRPELATTRDAIARSGPSAFYAGERARAIAAAVQAHGGVLTVADLAAYRPVWREPLRDTYRGAGVYTMPLPSSGGPTLLLALGVLSRHDPAAFGPGSPTLFHLTAEILKHGFAHRAATAGDPAFDRLAPLPVPDELARRIDSFRTRPARAYGPGDAAAHDAGTAHVSVLAADGSGVALTTTINTAFGAFIGVPGTGIVLNNQMDDFTFDAPNAFGLAPGRSNRIAPRKRPVSSMTPTLVVEDGRATVAVGASGGPLIVSATLQAVVGVLDLDATSASALEAPRIHHQWQPDILLVEPGVREIDRMALTRLGHAIVEIPGVAAVSLAVARPGRAVSAAGDPRKGGGAALAQSPARESNPSPTHAVPPPAPATVGTRR